MVNIKHEIRLAFGNNKSAIFISTLIFFVSMILGFIFAPDLYSFLNPVVQDLTNKVQQGIITLSFHDIFLNNIIIVFEMFIYGIIFCISLLILSFNGLFVGYYVGMSGDLSTVLLLIIPHGIFEFPSCILACASGIILFKFIFNFLKSIRKYNYVSSFKNRLSLSLDDNLDKLKQALIIFAIACVLMIIAGLVEVYLTIIIAKLLMPFF